LICGPSVKNSDTAGKSATPAETRHDWLLLLSLVLIWAISWPVIKVGVGEFPPIWYGALRYASAALILFALMAARGALVPPPRADWLLVIVSAGLQMAAYSALTGLALTILPPGRASVLAFSTPILVVPLAAWRLNEKLRPIAVAGVAIGLLGVLTVASPSIGAGKSQMLAYVLLMGAAAGWAITIVAVRGHRFSSSALRLAPWQMLIAAALLLPFAMLVEGAPKHITLKAAATLAYVAPIATAFAYWAVVEAGRRFAATTIAMALLATPSVGLIISALSLGEALDASLLIGAALTAVGIRLALTTTR
jgi:drug/metabolite transporter (DMT)-like permease